ncbi:MAG: hypothetical protein MJ069_05775 [Salinivirgaceae bacterium]|nr:hypothetical protein [Salinivirgaceae bacterium]
MKKQILTVAVALLTLTTMAQEKVRVHNGNDSYVTTIEQITFDVTDADQAISVGDLQKENATITQEKAALATEKTNLESQVSTLTNEKTTLTNANATITQEKATLASEKANLVADTTALKAEKAKYDSFLESKGLKEEFIIYKNSENGHAYVDLGLTSGTLWATCNIGATNPEDYGNYYAWGETETKSNYDWSTYKYMDLSKDSWQGCTKYTFADGQTEGVWYDSDGNFIGDNKTELDDADDVAVQLWGGSWKMPTKAQQDELRNECYWVWTNTYNGKSVNGYIVYKAKSESDKGVKITSGNTPSSNYNVATDAHIFLPADGFRCGTRLLGNDGYYWSRSLGANNSRSAYGMDFSSDNVWDGSYNRSDGFSVRAVCAGAQE